MKHDFLNDVSDVYKPIEICPEYEYKLDVDENGNEIIVVDHEKDIQAEMNALAKDCNIYNIILKHEAGDLTALNAKKGYYPTEEMVAAAESIVKGVSFEAKMHELYASFDAQGLSFDKFCQLVSEGKADELLSYKVKKRRLVNNV